MFLFMGVNRRFKEVIVVYNHFSTFLTSFLIKDRIAQILQGTLLVLLTDEE